MEKIAIISDIHGNKTALEAVLEDIHKRGVERIFCLGDLVGKGPQGSACIALVKSTCEKVIRGNWDVFIQEPQESAFLNWYQNQLTAEDNAYLASLPFSIDLEMNNQLIRCFHASPRSVFERISPGYHPEEKCLTLFENSEKTTAADPSKQPDIVFYGDIHTTMLTTYEIGILCNVGSVGNSLDLTSASYVILDGSYGTNAIEFIRVTYDRKAELAIAKEMEMPGYEQYYNELMFAKYRGRTS
ncbi:metallophosphoesterase family protein [Virgibacillus sp. 179-BFC.A HS]|uniref:Metallophosphoesterase family protein n=1 Tax=Tigheibacillus jepli TaxID=3035914 RepID=A0ABU5CJP1_9BACI|nr:metallophosphoesterase family protein [Virgibacillus sp. 179-BFC.A HS]MDY0406563.1 metallophosphoesterase family protein [Virgibacillus sp. 179-BFC.A HS]